MKKNKSAKIVLPETAELVVMKSNFLKGQLGIVSKKSFKKGASLFFVKGPIKKKPTKYSLSIGLDKHIEPKKSDGSFDFGYFFNHSCDPNTIIKIVESKNKVPYIKVVARRTIKPGEELTFDYASLEYEITASDLKCKCGKKTCRGRMCGFKDLPRNIVEKYKKEKIIPKYLLELRQGKK